MLSSLDLKQMIEMREKENKKLGNDLLELRKRIDTKMSQQILLHDQMVVNHSRMVDKCKVYKEELERANLESSRFKLVAQSLTSKVEELTGNKIEKRLDNSNEDEYKNMEDNSNMLMKELCMYKRSAEETYKELAVVNERLVEIKNELAKSVETETCLRKCVENLAALADAERSRHDQEKKKILNALNALMLAAKDDSQSDRLKLDMQRQMNDRLVVENNRLENELKKLDEVNSSLNEKVIELEQRIGYSNDTEDNKALLSTQRHRHTQMLDATSVSSQCGDEINDDDLVYSLQLKRSDHSPWSTIIDKNDPGPFSRSVNSYDFLSDHIPTVSNKFCPIEICLDPQE